MLQVHDIFGQLCVKFAGNVKLSTEPKIQYTGILSCIVQDGALQVGSPSCFLKVYQAPSGQEFRITVAGTLPTSFKSVHMAASNAITVFGCDSHHTQCLCSDPRCRCENSTRGDEFTCVTPTGSDTAFLIPVLVSLGVCLTFFIVYFGYQFVKKYFELKRKEQATYAKIVATAADYVNGLPFPMVHISRELLHFHGSACRSAAPDLCY